MEWIGGLSFLLFSGLAIHIWLQYQRCISSLNSSASLQRRNDAPIANVFSIPSPCPLPQATRGHPTAIDAPILNSLPATLPDSSYCFPTARIIICVKGCDPFLGRCLERLAQQDYPDYRISIVVDSETDEAYSEARRIQFEYGVDRIELIVRHRSYLECSRRASSLCSALEQLPVHVGIIAVCDGDAVVPTSWLSQLVLGFSGPEVMAVSGNRWYAPKTLGLANFSRYFWNALAVPIMNEFGIPWTGSLAFRRDLYEDPEFRSCLQHAFSEDTAIAKYLRARGLGLRLLPFLLVFNEESTTWRSHWDFLVRQILAVRLHHPDWPKVLVHALAIGTGLWILLPISLFSGFSNAIVTIVSGLLYAMSVVTQVARYERLLRQKLPTVDKSPSTLRWNRFLPLVSGLVLIAFTYPLAVVTARFTRTHHWRGVVYRIRADGVLVVDEWEFGAGA